ncbi:MAG TPA: carboxypeptidase-like regulatory domain-containing protein, partial [Bryobacteraceae bacterium]|nr:carboxypeptidase-like regulatory domain-containing protein [Bryobacteraceae bacterium]
MNRSFLLPLGVCLCGLASAAGPSKVCISVTDPAGLPIARARILVSPQQEQATFNGETNDAGSFCRNYAPGRYVVRAESEGFLASSIPFTAAEASQELEIRLGL